MKPFSAPPFGACPGQCSFPPLGSPRAAALGAISPAELRGLRDRGRRDVACFLTSPIGHLARGTRPWAFLILGRGAPRSRRAIRTRGRKALNRGPR
jgi:hypothetical protein